MPDQFNRNFDLALEGGKEWEDAFRGLLSCATIECKRDYLAHQTGNVFVEVECRGIPSGLAATKADWWAFGVCNSVADIETFVCASVPWLQKRWKEWRGPLKGGGEVDVGGRKKATLGFVIPIAEFRNRRISPGLK